MRITTKTLLKLGTCPNQVEIFAKEWPKGGEVNLKNSLRAMELNLSLMFLVHRLATAPAQKTLNEASASAWKTYNEAIASARKTYNEAIASAFVEAFK